MDLLVSKLFAIVTLGVGSLIVGLLPVYFTSNGRRQWPLLISCLLCFGGGVLLATSLTHMLPEVRESMPKYQNYSEVIYCAGFFILYIIDELVHCFYGDHDDSFSHKQHDHHHHHETDRRHSTYVPIRQSYGSSFERVPLVTDNRRPSFYKARSDSELFIETKAPSQLCHVGHDEHCKDTIPATNIGLLAALSVHALLEGLVVGLESTPAKVLLLFGAIASHKLVVGFCLGIELASNATNSKCRQIICIVIFALGSIGGIIIGMCITDLSNEYVKIGVPALQGLAGGTLLYVAVSEIIPRERARWHQDHSKKLAGIYQFFAVTGGFSIMTIFSKYLEA